MSASNVFAISGTVLFREKLAMPPGGVVTVKLVDTAGEVLAATSVDAENGPTEFTVQADPADFPDPRRLLLLGPTALGRRRVGHHRARARHPRRHRGRRHEDRQLMPASRSSGHAPHR